MKKLNVCLFAAYIALFPIHSVLCQTSQHDLSVAKPYQISYQGLLHLGVGNAPDGPQVITVRLYADAGGKQLVWEDDFNTTLQNGVFNLSLGSGRPLPEASKLTSPLWLATSVANGEELRPLTQLSASPYALSVADGSITSAKMGTDFVGSISINGQRVGGRGTDVNFVAGSGLTLAFDPGSNAVMLGSAAPASNGKGASAQDGDDDINMHGHKIVDASVIQIGDPSATTGSLRLYNSANSHYATLQAASQSSNRTYTIPDVGANSAFVMLAGAQTITGAKTFSAGAAMGNPLDMSGNQINNLATPTASTDAATKGYVDNLGSNVSPAIANEIANRQAAVSAEAAARAAGDATLTANLTGEVSRAEAAEGALSANINTENSNLQAAIAAEAASRATADNTLTTSINNETASRQAAVTGEAASRAAADNTLTTNLNNEIANRQAAITAEANTRGAAINALSAGLNNEVTRATAAESDLQAQISTSASPTFAGLTLNGSPFINYGNFYQAAPSFFYSDVTVYAGESIGGTLDMNFNPIVDVPDPTNASDAVDKNYVDVLFGQLSSSLTTVNNVTVDYSGNPSGTYSGHTVTVSGSTANVVDLVGYNSFVSGSDDQNIGIKATGEGSGGGNSIGGDFTGHNTSGGGYAIGGRFAATGATNNIAVQATSGAIQVQTAGEGIILKSPNGTCYKLTVANNGTLTTTAVACP